MSQCISCPASLTCCGALSEVNRSGKRTRLDIKECDAEIIKDHNALTYTLKPRDLEEAADMACQLKISDMNTVFPDVSGNSFLCFPISAHL